jgi:NAD(P)-dependent dehydrogenase (short-subunit alcohol dehydrogenase family)
MSDSTSISSRVWFITGCSTGFGRALADAVLARGDQVVVTARDVARVTDFQERAPQQVLAVALDVKQPDSVRAAVNAAIERFGRIDVLVNNAGYGLLGAIEELTDDEIRNQFQTNVFGLFDVTRAVLPHMRNSRRGHILNTSSLGGFVGTPGFGVYSATKFAVEGFSEALAQEVAPLGIHVTIVEPGAFRTDWAGRSLVASSNVIEDYALSSGLSRQWIDENNGQQPGSPARAATAMISAVEAAQPPLRLVLGADALESIRGKLASVIKELNTWEETTRSTAFEDRVGVGC